jgi:hypothetical protein
MLDGKWKLLVNADGSDVQLYDVVKDKSESINVATEQAEVAQRMKEQALTWRKSLP